MNRNAYLNIIMTFIAAAALFFGIVMINALDRIHFDLKILSERITQLENSGTLVPLQRTAAGAAAESAASRQWDIANHEFYDPAAEPGGRLINVMSNDTKNMNYLVNNDAYAGAFNNITNASLAERNYEKPEIFQPQLAESWQISPDKKVYSIKLRKGILWHDFTDPVTGREWKDRAVTAYDFKFYVDVIKNPDTNCAPLRVYMQDLEKIEVISDYEFKVYWKNRYFKSEEMTLGLSPLPRHLYNPDGGSFDGKKFNDDHRRNRIIVGCGPYRFLRWDKEQRVVFVGWEKYFGRQYGVMPPIKVLAYDIIKHPNTQFQALLSGQVDMLSLTPEQWVTRTNGKEFAPDGPLRKIQYPARSFYYIGYNLKNPLFQDRRVRQALTCLINREKILKDVYFGLGRIVSGPFFIDSPYYDHTIRPYPFDIEKAKSLLREAGWKDSDGDGILDLNGKKFEFIAMQVSGSTIQQKMLPVIKEDMAKAGIDMKIQAVEWSVYTQRLENKSFDACTLGWNLTYEDDPYQIWHSSQADREGSSNHIGFKNAAADRLIEEIRGTFDIQKRIALCHKFHRLLHEEQPYTFLFAPYNLIAVSANYRNVRRFPLGIPSEIFWTPKALQKEIPGL